ncbi:MAG: serine/threonine protein kinase [Gammaproteobacteria bacterium]|nr:MAG: serine/threonine protein kinase [Gammaproteobacteria bacterium]
MELPGFRIEREIGRGGMARVHLAVQNKFGRLVALKVVSADYANDTNFRKRFLSESRINAQLTHPNIVQVYDVGAHESLLFLVMEYLRGGDLNQRLEKGMHVTELIDVINDIGKALDYAHHKGFIHRDIKPENILFREDGSAVLTDFGIARTVSENPSLTLAGTVVGTPQYMSPEQASGRELDGRSDLYSLGVVFYRMLTGDVPYEANSAVSIGIKHLQEPIPRLPNYLDVFQPMIDRMLAKKPEHRYQTGAELSAALDEVRTSTRLPNATIKSKVVTTQEIRAVGTTLLTTARDPVRAKRRSRRQRRQRLFRRFTSLGLVFVLVGIGSWIFVQQPQWINRLMTITGIIEDPMVQVVWNDAQSLHQDPNQSLDAIVAGYRRVLSIEPEHLEARSAIEGLAAQWKDDILQALQQGNLAAAETKLIESIAAFPEDPVLADLSQQLTNHQHADSLLTTTQALLRSHGLSDIPSATAAIQAYKEVLRLAPDHAVAVAELDALAEHYSDLAGTAADNGDVDSAMIFLDRASAANAKLPDLALAREKIQQATTLRAAIAEMLQQASAHRVAGALINPAGENAAELYHSVLATDPDNVIAIQGIGEIVSQLLNLATQLLADGQLSDLQDLVDRASAVGLAQTAVNEIKERLDSEVLRLATVERHLSNAELLLSQGFITEPQEGNAVFLLREVERLDAGNVIARALLSRSAARLASVAQEAWEVGLTEDAKHYLELALTVTPDVEIWRRLREDWEKNPATR